MILTMRKSPRSLRRGFTLTEVAIVVGIIGTISAAIWWAAGNAREAQRENDALNEMQTVVSNIDGMMMGQSFSSPFGDITSNMISAQTIPTTYRNASAPTTAADNPWSAGNFHVYGMSAKTFRVSFYNVSNAGCVALLTKGTACQSGQSGCPSEVYTDGVVAGTPAQSYLPGAGVGWTVMTVNVATTMCAANSYTGGTNSVEFDYSL